MTRVISSSDESAKTQKNAKKRANSNNDAPTEDDIRILAYDLFEKRQADGSEGTAVTDWLEAKRLLLGDSHSLQD